MQNTSENLLYSEISETISGSISWSYIPKREMARSKVVSVYTGFGSCTLSNESLFLKLYSDSVFLSSLYHRKRKCKYFPSYPEESKDSVFLALEERRTSSPTAKDYLNNLCPQVCQKMTGNARNRKREGIPSV